MATGLTERERELRVKLKGLWDAQVPLVEKVGAGESLTVEERTAYKQRDEEITTVRGDLQDVLDMRDAKDVADTDGGPEPDTRGARGGADENREKAQWDAFSRWFKGGEQALTNEQRGYLTPHVKGVPVNEGSVNAEIRLGPGGDASPMQVAPLSVSVTGGSQGGYLVPPAFWHNLQIALKAYGGAYRLFEQVDTDTGAPMDWATTNPTTIIAQPLAENTVVTPQDVTFGIGQLNAWTFVAGPFLASIQLVNDSAFDVDSFLRDRIAEAIGRAQAQQAWTGSGSSAPLGITTALVAAGSGSVGAGGVLVQGANNKLFNFANGTTAVTEVVAQAMSFETVFQLLTYVDPAYRNLGDCVWVMNDATLQNERTVTDAYNRPLIQQNVNMGGTTLGDTLAGYPVVIDNNAPSIGAGSGTPTASGVAGPVFGRFRTAMVARNVRQTGVMVLRERYADYLAIGWLGYMRFDIRSNDMRALASVSYHT